MIFHFSLISRTAAHVWSLTWTNPNGTTTGCLEQRVSNFAIQALIGVGVLWTAPRLLLQQVLLAALSGVFLFLGEFRRIRSTSESYSRIYADTNGLCLSHDQNFTVKAGCVFANDT